MRFLVFLIALFSGFHSARADNVVDSAREFHAIFMNALSPDQRARPDAEFLHFVPDANVTKAAAAASIEEALATVKTSSVDSLLAATNAAPTAEIPSDLKSVLRKHPMTMVIVPGIFGEFIRVRPFEDIFSQPSSFANEYGIRVKAATAAGSSDATDLSYSSETTQLEPLSMSTLVQAASIDDTDGTPLVRVILLYAPYASLETLGDLSERAAMMNRRLGKYLTLTKDIPQNLVLVGYSRGTTYALEMLAQANQEILNSVRGMISYNGVIWGSTSADQTVDPNQPISHLIADVKELRNSLQPSWTHFAQNTFDYVKFAAQVVKLNQGKPVGLDLSALGDFAQDPIVGAALNIDLIGSSIFLYRELANLGLKDPAWEYSQNIVRAQNLVDAALTGVDQLRTEQRLQWWRSHVLPANINYYAITSTMANPSDSAVSKQAFDNSMTYDQGSFEDQFLLKNRNDYMSASGVGLNDSQVAVPQAMFLPNLMRALNPAQPPLKTQFLGTMGTHHWGAALEIVFDMRNKSLNPYPRAALMQALASKAALDLENQK